MTWSDRVKPRPAGTTSRMEIAYYTCLNNDCQRHRNIFVEGDPQHADCASERLYLEGQEKPGLPAWVWLGVPAALALGAAVFVLLRKMRGSARSAAPSDVLRERLAAANVERLEFECRRTARQTSSRRQSNSAHMTGPRDRGARRGATCRASGA